MGYKQSRVVGSSASSVIVGEKIKGWWIWGFTCGEGVRYWGKSKTRPRYWTWKEFLDIADPVFTFDVSQRELNLLIMAFIKIDHYPFAFALRIARFFNQYKKDKK